MSQEISNQKFKLPKFKYPIINIITILLFLILSSFFGLATITGGSILSESYEHLEEFKKLEKSHSLNNLPVTVSEDLKYLISIYHNSETYELSIESDKNLIHVFLLLFIVTLVVTIKLLIDIIKYRKN